MLAVIKKKHHRNPETVKRNSKERRTHRIRHIYREQPFITKTQNNSDSICPSDFFSYKKIATNYELFDSSGKQIKLYKHIFPPEILQMIVNLDCWAVPQVVMIIIMIIIMIMIMLMIMMIMLIIIL